MRVDSQGLRRFAAGVLERAGLPRDRGKTTGNELAQTGAAFGLVLKDFIG
ncbi:MAG: hypothetical protein BWY88_00548 [Synergistetes bacterium ADurb.Bin520]|nr:MAG: hypothetical protein BWY88_00548 [Synergistetes bacterium ADurb.Bin520]